jgi:hypothetical protein
MEEPNFVNSTEGNGSQYYNRLCATFVSQHYTHSFRILVISICFTLSGYGDRISLR